MIKGLKIATGNSGIKYKNRDDLLIVEFEEKASVAGVFTKSSMPASPVIWCRKNINNFDAKALVVNAGNANAFTGILGEETVIKTAEKMAKIFNCKNEEIYICSTGVIGEPINNDLLLSAIEKVSNNLENEESSYLKGAKAIMTTDTREKLVKKTCKIGEELIEIIGFVKGSGMIAPNMATMLGYIFTDANISKEVLQKLLKNSVEKSFNAITVDSDTSTNDTVLLFATKKAKHEIIGNLNSNELQDFIIKLDELTLELAKMLVIDGEGAKKLIEIEVSGAKTKESAKEVAFAIANSPLVKTAIAGSDPNWGRIVMAVGKSCSDATPQKLIIKIGDYLLTKDGAKNPNYIENLVHEYLKNSEIKIFVDLAIGSKTFKVWTCDLNEEYIKINKDYRS